MELKLQGILEKIGKGIEIANILKLLRLANKITIKQLIS